MIPHVLHFIWITVDKSPSDDFFIGPKSAVANTTMKVVLHTNDRTIPPIRGVEIRYREFDTAIKGIPLNQTPPMQYKGNNASRIAHLCDIYRLDILYEEGGVYSDMDCIWLRNPWEFWNKRVVVGYTNKGYKILSNGVLMSQAREPALLEYKKWLVEIYPNKKYWIPANPYKLWKNREEVTKIDKYYFFPISWNKCDEITYEKVQKSICVSLFASMGKLSGEMVDLVKQIIAQLDQHTEVQSC